MHKIISLFQKDPAGEHLVRDEVTPGAEWVLRGEGRATRKWDGTCCLVRKGVLYKRHTLKLGKKTPPGFEPVEHDPNTGKTFGWRPVGSGPEDQWHREAFTGHEGDGTYELCGPKVQGNPEGFGQHILLPHGMHPEPDAPRTFEGLKEWFATVNIEGIVWHHEDGRMVKIKAKDFGIQRGQKT